MATVARERTALLVARCCMASLFVFSGLEKALDYGGAVAFATAFGVPLARYLLVGAIVVELGGAAALVSPRWCRVGATILAAWVLVLTVWFHQFWTVPADRWQDAVDGFFHHWVMIGGLVYVAVLGDGGRPAASAS